MANFLEKFFATRRIRITNEELIAYQSRIPDSLNVYIKESKDGGYWVRIENLPGCFTQANNGKELFKMVNDALYTYYEIPERCLIYMPKFLPPEQQRRKFGIKVPEEFLNKQLIFQGN